MTENSVTCGMCKKDTVRIEFHQGNARGGVSVQEPHRSCTNPDCPSNTGAPTRLGDSV